MVETKRRVLKIKNGQHYHITFEGWRMTLEKEEQSFRSGGGSNRHSEYTLMATVKPQKKWFYNCDCINMSMNLSAALE